MKQIKYSIIITLLISLFISCNKDLSEKKEISENIEKNINESELLINFLEQTSNYVNSNLIPALISAKELNKNKSDYLLLDIRTKEDYILGHIDGAINIKFEDIYNYLMNEIHAGAYKKIVIIGYTGQEESYATSLLRMIGFNNAFALKFGMSSWSKDLAKDYWIANIGNKYLDKIQTTITENKELSDFPDISTGEKTGFDIAKSRVKELFSKGSEETNISIDDLMKSPENYYIVAYWNESVNLKEYLPNSIRYNQRESLDSSSELNTLPTDKTIVVYCFSGHHSAQVVGFLNILGYKAKSLNYGTNSFMFNDMKKNLSVGKYFDAESMIMNYNLTTGELPSKDLPSETIEEEKTPSEMILPVKKEKKEETGGC